MLSLAAHLSWSWGAPCVCDNTQVLTGEVSITDVRSSKNGQVEVFECIWHGHNCNGSITESEHPQNCSSNAVFPVCSGNGAEPATGSSTVEAHRCMRQTLTLKKKVTLAESDFHVARIWGTHGTRMHDKKKASRQRQRDAFGQFSAMKPLVPPSGWIL